MSTQTEIRPSDPIAATYRTDISGWVSRDGRYYGDGTAAERTARFAGSNVSECQECGVACPKSRIRCDACQAKATRARFDALPLVTEYDYPLALFDGDEYFFDSDELESYCDSREIDPESLMLVTCKPQSLREIDADYWESELPEDGELPKAIADALDTFNAVIREHGQAVSYLPDNKRVAVTCADIGLTPLTAK